MKVDRISGNSRNDPLVALTGASTLSFHPSCTFWWLKPEPKVCIYFDTFKRNTKPLDSDKRIRSGHFRNELPTSLREKRSQEKSIKLGTSSVEIHLIEVGHSGAHTSKQTPSVTQIGGFSILVTLLYYPTGRESHKWGDSRRYT